MTIKASGSTVIIRRTTETAKGAIHIPEIAELNSQQGIVVSVGPGQRDLNGVLHALPFKEGDRVVFNRLGIINITVGGEALCAVKSQDIFGTLEDQNE